MTDVLTQLAERALKKAPTLEPRRPSLFEPAPVEPTPPEAELPVVSATPRAAQPPMPGTRPTSELPQARSPVSSPPEPDPLSSLRLQPALDTPPSPLLPKATDTPAAALARRSTTAAAGGAYAARTTASEEAPSETRIAVVPILEARSEPAAEDARPRAGALPELAPPPRARLTAPGGREDAATAGSAPPPVQVYIGRLEIDARALPEAPRAELAAPSRGLDAYLAGRASGGRP